MRFATRFDRWLVVLLAFAALVSCGLMPFLRFFDPGTHPGPKWMAFMAWPLWLAVLSAMLPQYYEVRENGLFIRQGWRRILIPYASLIEVQSVTNSMSAAVFSSQRILIVTTEGRRVLIAVAEDERFLAEVARRAPQLERKAFGLGLPFAPSTFV
jgi:hypothetical protein